MNGPQEHAAIRERDFLTWCEWQNYTADDREAPHAKAFLTGHEMASTWDDAIHIAAPWERRASLCGNWFRNLVPLNEERPDGMAGCWTCLMAAEWLDANRAASAGSLGADAAEDT